MNRLASRLRPILLGAIVMVSIASAARAAGPVAPMKFDFSPTAKAAEGWTSVTPDAAYSAERGYGFEDGAKVEMIARDGAQAPNADFVTAAAPFRFSVKVPEGNYRVRVTLGDAAGESTTTVKSESRRLMLERVRTGRGEFVTRSFIVNTRTPAIAGGSEVRLTGREVGTLHWDDKLTLEFLDERPCVAAIEVERADDVPTLFLAGDSTVTDQPNEPWCGWGQILPRFVKPDVAISNHAESGRTLGSFYGDRRLPKIMSMAKPGDYLFIQFGHNDMKDQGPNAGAFKNYKQNLERAIADARAKDVTPIVMTPMHRRRFDSAGKVENTFGDYPAAARQVAQEQMVMLIDLNNLSAPLYEAMGDEASKQAFVHYPANTFPGQNDALRDNTHHNVYGAYQLAKCVVEAIRTGGDEKLKAMLADDVKPFDPSKPDPVDAVKIPVSATFSAVKPAGS